MILCCWLSSFTQYLQDHHYPHDMCIHENIISLLYWTENEGEVEAVGEGIGSGAEDEGEPEGTPEGGAKTDQENSSAVKLQHLHFFSMYIINSPNVMPIRGMSHTELLSAGVQFPERRCVMFFPAGHPGSSGADEVTFTGEFTGIVNPSISPLLKWTCDWLLSEMFADSTINFRLALLNATLKFIVNLFTC